MNASLPLPIEKEHLGAVSFSNKEVLQNAEAIRSRSESLQKACMFGNSYKGKVRIAFATTEGPREVYTTIWTVSNGHVSLKNGLHIPVHSIFHVTF